MPVDPGLANIWMQAFISITVWTAMVVSLTVYSIITLFKWDRKNDHVTLGFDWIPLDHLPITPRQQLKLTKEIHMLAFTALAAVLLAPLVSLLSAMFRAVVLFWPTMILFGAVHSYLPFVPALGYVAAFFVVALISILVPTGTNTTTTSS